MFYCTVYQRQSKGYLQGRIRLCLSFNSEKEAADAKDAVIDAATGFGADIRNTTLRNDTLIAGEIDCPGPVSSEIFTQGGREKYYLVCVENDDTLASRRRQYHPLGGVLVDGSVFMQKYEENKYFNAGPDWYNELSDINN